MIIFVDKIRVSLFKSNETFILGCFLLFTFDILS